MIHFQDSHFLSRIGRSEIWSHILTYLFIKVLNNLAQHWSQQPYKCGSLLGQGVTITRIVSIVCLGNTKGGSITVPLNSCLTVLESAV
jgi:hypothetical protein